MKSSIKVIITSFILSVLFTACMNKDPFPEQPVIKYKDFIAMDGDSARLIFEFTDGDGDLGVNEGDTDQTIFLKYFEMQMGEWVEFAGTDVSFTYSIPYLTPTGRNKSIEGDIQVLIYPYYNFTSSFDTLKYQVYIVDRAKNQSNVIETEDIVRPPQ